MKTLIKFSLAVAALLSTLNPQLSTTFAQGSLTPPGPPAPTMKTLAQIEPRTPISSLPLTITNAGSYYVTTNLVGVNGQNGITISNGNVTLDLNGFALLGVPGSLKGVFVSGTYTNLTVRNGTVSGWGGAGVDAYFGASHNLVFERLTVSANGGYGIITAAASVVRDCLSQSNQSYGIYSSGGLISGCVVRDSGDNGIVAYNGVVRDCQVQSSAAYGIFASSCVVRDCQVQSSAAYGIFANLSEVRDCRIESSGSYGIYLTSGTVSGCWVQSSAQNGIYVNAPGCQVLGNTCQWNNTLNNAGYAGIYINDGDNRVEGNHVTASGAAGAGILVHSPPYMNNVIIKNSVSGNGANNYVVPGSQVVGPLITTYGTITNSNPWANFSF